MNSRTAALLLGLASVSALSLWPWQRESTSDSSPVFVVAADRSSGTSASLARDAGADAGAGARVAAAARAFVASLDPKQRQRACLPFRGEERTNWQFVPGIYPGVPLQELRPEQRQGVHRLLLSVLSASGYHKTTAIMKLEDSLREFAEAAGRKAPHRDPGRYALAVFGEPAAKGAWGFRLQGHHISWNVTSIDGVVVATQPAFLGANPAEIRQGVHAGLRALPAEEDVARDLMGQLTAAQRKQVVVEAKAPQDVLWGPGKTAAAVGEIRGLAWSAMEPAQQRTLWRLIEVYAHNLKHDLAASELQRITAAGKAGIHFAWMGSTTRGEGHYYRIQGPTFVIEYDNTQNQANHVHTVWHDPTRDFGGSALRRHYEEHHRKK